MARIDSSDPNTNDDGEPRFTGRWVGHRLGGDTDYFADPDSFRWRTPTPGLIGEIVSPSAASS